MSIIKAKRFPYESYIFGWYLPEKFCNDVLRWHKHNPDLSKTGVCLDRDGNSGSNDSYKKSTDKDFNVITAFELYNKYLKYLDEGMSCQFQSFGQEELFDPKYDKYNIFNMKSFDMPVERGTLLIFKSSLPHKVMKTNNERYSVAGNFIVTDLKDFNIV